MKQSQIYMLKRSDLQTLEFNEPENEFPHVYFILEVSDQNICTLFTYSVIYS